ncbi:MAG: FGGY family carbohydrate kinase [Egibacteraceae bacterium]
MAEVLLGIDIGTSNTKAVIAHADGAVLATAQREHATSYPRPGFVEHDPEEIWWNDFTALTAELLEQADGPIAGVSVSGIGACTLPADADGNPVRDAILYGVDTRAGEEIDELLDRYGESEILERTLSAVSHGSVGPKLLWLQHHEPDVWERTKQLLMPNSFIIERLTDEYTLDSISASFCIPMFDPRTRTWIDEWAEEVAPGLALPRVVEPWEEAGRISERGAELTGLPANIPICAGTIDAFVESASVGVKEPGDVMLTYGTTMGIAGLVDEPVSSGTLNSKPGVFPGTHILIGPTATSGAVTDWLRAVSDGKPFDSVRSIIETLSEASVPIERVVAVGGGTRGALWTQIVSDVTGLSQELSEVTIGACYGDCLFAARAAGLIDNDTDWATHAEQVEPVAEHAELYDTLYRIYGELYPATLSQSHELAKLQTEQGMVPDG